MNRAEAELPSVPRAEITTDFEPGTVTTITQHDGSSLRLAKLHETYDPTDRAGAMAYLQMHAKQGNVVTGLLYVESDAEDLHGHLGTVAAPLNTLNESGAIFAGLEGTLAAINEQEYR